MNGLWNPTYGLALAAIILVSVTGTQKLSSRQPSFTAKCKATDGDSLRCGNLRIRLLGVDAAEMPGHCKKGRVCAAGNPYKQKAALARFAREPLTLRMIKTDHYGRIITSVTNHAGYNASCAVIRAGASYIPRWDHDQIIATTCTLENKQRGIS